MKRKKQVWLISSLVLSLSLAGCMGPALPKDAYIKGVKKMEETNTYQKKSLIDVDIETNGTWEENETVLFSLLNESTLEAVSVTDETKKQSETTLRLLGGFDYLPVDATLHLLYDENKEKTYLEGAGLVSSFAPFIPLSPLAKDKWVEVGTSKNPSPTTNGLRLLLAMDFSSVWSTIPEENFARISVTEKEKQEGIRDIVTVSFQQEELPTLFPSSEPFAKQLAVEGVTFTAYLDRKGHVVKEEILTKWVQKKAANELIVHAVMTSSYSRLNEPVSIEPAPKPNEILSFDEFFQNKTKTEKP